MPSISQLRVKARKKKVVTSATDFNKAMKGLSDLSLDTFSQLAGLTALNLWVDIISNTPVDTGRARANWQLGVVDTSKVVECDFQSVRTKTGRKKRRPPPRGQIKTDPKLPHPTKIDELGKSDSIWIVNNLPYIEKLEAGSSIQSPTGMVAKSLQIGAAFLRDKVQELK